MRLLIILTTLLLTSLAVTSQETYPQWTLSGGTKLVTLTERQFKDANKIHADFIAVRDSLSTTKQQLVDKDKTIDFYARSLNKSELKGDACKKQITLYKDNEVEYKSQIGILNRQIKIRNVVIGVCVGVIIVEGGILIIKSL